MAEFYHGFLRMLWCVVLPRIFTLKLCIYDASSGPRQTGQASLIGHQLGDQLYDAENKIDTIASDTWYSRSSHYVGWHDTEGVAKRNPRLRATRSRSGIRPFRSCCRWSRWLSTSPRLCGGFAVGAADFVNLSVKICEICEGLNHKQVIISISEAVQRFIAAGIAWFQRFYS